MLFAMSKIVFEIIAFGFETLKGHSLFGHITLTRSERSAIAALVTEMLESNEVV